MCAAFNADFDGDQMAVHLPLSDKAQAEAKEIMLSSTNILKPSSGDPIINPSQDMVLGCYFLTQMIEGKKGEGMGFGSEAEAIYAYECGHIHLQAKIKVRHEGETIETTVGRIFFNQAIPEGIEYQNESFGKKELSNVLGRVYAEIGEEATAKLADDIKDMGFKYATKSGISVSVFDLKAPESKTEIIEKANSIVRKINDQFGQGLITDEERYNHTIKIWSRVKGKITQEMIQEYEKENDIFYQIDSGARGNWGQITQMAGMKGLVASPSGRTIELPIRSNLKEGFTILEYFIATHGGRKGKSDTALKTAEAGYLTRRLVDSVQDVVVHEKDCGTERSKLVTRENSAEVGQDFERRLYGRTVAADVKKGKKVLLAKGRIIDEEGIQIIRDNQLEEVNVRSVMFCETLGGVCQECYGYDLGNNKIVEKGTPVGIIAAQSIGEPGTQLTMRTFHMGGVATEEASITQGLTRVEELFEARKPNGCAALAEISGKVSIRKKDTETKITIEAEKPEDDVHLLGLEFEPAVKKGDAVKEKQIIARSTESRSTIKARSAGKVKEVRADAIVIKQDEAAQRVYTVSPRLNLKVKSGEMVNKGRALTAGHLDLRELMELTTVEKVQEYILFEVQSIYASQGQDINEKHIEIIAKQMVSKARVLEAGDSGWLPGEIKDVVEVNKKNAELAKKKKNEAQVERLLLGLTRVSLWTDSWLSAASFQETTRVLVEAATTKKTDYLDGLKENVIIGRLIPAGTGFGAREKVKR